MGEETGPCKAGGGGVGGRLAQPTPSPLLSLSRSPVHDDVHVAAVPLEAGTQQDVIPAGEADLHRVVGHHLGVCLQHGLEFQQGLLGLLSALGRGSGHRLREGSPGALTQGPAQPPSPHPGTGGLPALKELHAAGCSPSPSHRKGA